MPGFAEEFEEGQTLIKMYKMKQNIHRALELQARSKIKPSSMNPNLLTMSNLKGGVMKWEDYLRENPQEKIYYDLRNGKRIDEQDVIQLEAKNSPAAPVARKMYEDQKNNRPIEQRDRNELDVISTRIAKGGAEPVPLDLYWPSATQNQDYK